MCRVSCLRINNQHVVGNTEVAAHPHLRCGIPPLVTSGAFRQTSCLSCRRWLSTESPLYHRLHRCVMVMGAPSVSAWRTAFDRVGAATPRSDEQVEDDDGVVNDGATDVGVTELV